MKIYITGATGYVGANLIPRLVKENHDVTCLVRNPEKYLNSTVYQKCHLIKGDISVQDSLQGTISNMDMVIHLAVLGHLNEKRQSFEDFYTVNVLGTKNILTECRVAGPKRIVCFSTTAAIGIPKVSLIDENTPLRPVSPYGQSKKEADEVISLFVKKNNLPIITLCFPHIYGPGEQRDFLKIIRMIKKGIFPQVGFSPNLYPSIFITDALDAICLAMTKGKIGEKYIMADDDSHDLRVIRRLVLRQIGSKKKLYPFMPKYLGILGAHVLESLFAIFGTVPPVTAKSIKSITAGRRLCIEKARKHMGFEPKVDIEEGIKRTIGWAQKEHLL